jgi:uncharacterized protein
LKIYAKQIPLMARDILKALMDAGDIEVEASMQDEARQDLAAVLNEFVRMDRELSDLTKDVLVARGWSSSHFSEARQIAASMRKVPQGDEAVDYVIEQLLEALLISNNIAEVYAEDHIMRKRIVDIVRHYQKMDEEVDTEVRKRLKNIEEGSREWDVAYRKTIEEVRRLKGLV